MNAQTIARLGGYNGELTDEYGNIKPQARKALDKVRDGMYAVARVTGGITSEDVDRCFKNLDSIVKKGYIG